MGLVTNSKDSLYGGVNQQAAEHRLPTQVEEAVNVYPTVNLGLLKRNPTVKLPLNDTIDYTSDMWVYAYDRGLAGASEEKYSIHITKGGMFIIDTVTGNVFNKLNGKLIFDNTDAETYLYPFGGSTGYSAVTIKDTTFLLNKNVQPRMKFQSYSGVDTSVEIKNVKTINLNETVKTLFDANDHAPYNIKEWKGKFSGNEGGILTNVIITSRFDDKPSIDLNGIPVSVVTSGFTLQTLSSYNIYKTFTLYDIKGCTVNIAVDGYSTSYTTNPITELDPAYDTLNSILDSRETFFVWLTNIKNRIIDMLPNNEYKVRVNADNTIDIIKYDGTAMTATFSITMDTSAYRTLPSKFIIESEQTLTGLEADFYTGIGDSTTNETVVNENTTYATEGFVWIKSSNPTTAYTYNVTVKDSLGNIATHSETTSTTTETAATAIATAINANANFTATSVGSVVKIVSVATGAEIKSVETSDSYGNQASFGWAKTVSNYTELPKKLGFEDAMVYVEGDITSSFKGYWLEYLNGSWKETVAPNINTVVDSTTMPHILIRDFDGSGNPIFRLTQWDKWGIREVGDNDSNPLPSFMNDNDAIKDIFFFKNRLGFITTRNVLMSDVGNYGNFFRTTVTTVLDSDRIDTTVDTTKAIRLEYVTYLEDSLMLFSDKAQFKLEGGAILSPKSIQVSQTSAYEINKNIRPIFMNDKVFFCAIRGNYTALMQYQVFGDGRISEAVDLTAHADKYVPSNVKSLSGSSINNTLFLTTEGENTIYVYKYLDSGNDRIQSAWFKWEYNGEVYNAFSLGRNFNVLINRYQSSVVSDWVLGSGIWDGTKHWTSDGIWIASPAALATSKNFEVQEIHPKNHKAYFIDASEFVIDTDVVENISSTVTSSVLVYACNVQMLYASTLSIDNDSILTYTIQVDTFLGNTYTSTNEDLLLPRTPADFVTSITITINDVAPIVFTGISFTYDSAAYPDELLYNGLFQNGIVGWTFTDWTVNYGEKDIGSIIPARVDLGEWVFKANGLAQTRGSLKMKTCQINSEDGSDFELEVQDIKRNSIRTVKSRYTVDRKPMVYGDSKNMRLAILNNSEKGFRINSVSLEGNYNSRNKRTS